MPSLVFFSPGWYNPLIKTKGVRSMKRCLVLSDSFKGTLSSPDICRIARSLHIPGWHIDALPVADGGEGTTDCFLDACGGQRIALSVSGPFGGTIDGFYGLLPDGTAVVECAAAAGLHQAEGRPDPEAATTYGVGQLLAHALDHGAKRLILGLGGSCTNDARAGAAAALGTKFYNEKGESFVPTGDTLEQIVSYDTAETERLLSGCTVTAMCDIDNPMYGAQGAAAIFAPQKGADKEMVALLDRNLVHLGNLMQQKTGADIANMPGAGAAGAFGAGIVAFLGGKLQSGIETVLECVRFDELLAGADMVFTGEGQMDSQSLHGKAVIGIAGRAAKKHVPVTVIVGSVGDGAEGGYEMGVSALFSINRRAESFDISRGKTRQNFEATMDAIVRLLALKA